jgi:hypothetical protein
MDEDRLRARSVASEHIIAVAAYSAIMTVASIVQLFREGAPRDFATFYASGQAFLSGHPLYPEVGTLERINLNPPSLTVFAFAPLSTLPYEVAIAVWTGLGLVALLFSMRAIQRELALPARVLVATSAALLALPGSIFVWNTGQLTWLLLLPTTLAWINYRRSRESMSGLWLAPVVAVKPFFVLAVLPLGWRATLSCALGGALLSGAGVAITGWAAWGDWLAVSDYVHWLQEPANASIPGILAKFMASSPVDPVGLDDFAWFPRTVWGLSLVAVVLAAWLIPPAAPDEKWCVAVAGAILTAPLGWMYYLPLLAGPTIARWYRSGGHPALWLHFTPYVAIALTLRPHWLYVTAGSWFAWALVVYWLQTARDGLRRL